jgi:type IV secretory pathway VirB2 component (pilin)
MHPSISSGELFRKYLCSAFGFFPQIIRLKDHFMRITVTRLTFNIALQSVGPSTQFHDIFTGPIAKGLSLVAVIVGVLMFSQGESRRRKIWACVLFGLGLTVLIANFLAWILGT